MHENSGNRLGSAYIKPMTRFAPTLALRALLPVAALAQEETEDHGFGLMERGPAIFLDGTIGKNGPVYEGGSLHNR